MMASAVPAAENDGHTARTRLRAVLGVIGITAAALAARLATLPRAPDVPDSVVFVRGVIRFSVTETRPYWPGYPVCMWAGKIVDVVVKDPVLALHLVSALSSVLVAWPLAWVARAWASSLSMSPSPARAGWAAVALWLVTPMAWVTGSQIFSDPLGLLFGVCVLALCVAGERGGAGWWVGAAVLGGLMVGVRLVNVTMLGPLVWKAWVARWERWRGFPVPVALFAGVTAGVAPWLGFLLLDAPVPALISGGLEHVGGHFLSWGGSVLTDSHSMARPLRALRNLAVHGLGAGVLGWQWPRIVASAAWLTALAAGMAQRPWRGPVARQVGLWAVPHLAYVFLGHDVSYPRYMLSAVALLCVIGGLAASGNRRVGLVAVAIATTATAVVSAPIAVAQKQQPPVDYRVARFLARQPRAAVLVTNAPSLLLYLQDEAPGTAFVVAPAREAERWRREWEAEGRRVFTTAPPEDNSGDWRPAAHFCRDPLIDPRLGYDAWLFAPVSTPAPYPAPDCYTAE